MFIMNIEIEQRDVIQVKDEDAQRQEEANQMGGEQVEICVGNPSVEVIRGTLSLYRSLDNADSEIEENRLNRLPNKRSSTICLLAVPEYLSPSEIFKFFGGFLQCIHKIRFVRQVERPGVYSCILEFWKQNAADDFFLEYDGKRFSSLEQDVCRAVFVEALTFDQVHDRVESSEQTEMPSCPVCLERLDSHVSGIVTTVCNHDFHTQCLKNCATTSCPVCRYTQTPSPGTSCNICGSLEDLWICLVCGHVGCCRYAGGHARKHWEDTGHCYSMELQTQRVWDYIGDEYVHRLIKSKVDGHLVEVPSRGEVLEEASSPAMTSDGKGMTDVILSSKLEAISFEYNNLLTAQLDSQRQYFEERITKLQDEVEDACQSLNQHQDLSNAALKKARQSDSNKKNAEKKVVTLTSQVENLEKENGFLRDLNESLLRDQNKWQDKIKHLECESSSTLSEKNAVIEDLQEQLQDLMMYLDAQNIASNSEMKEGTVLTVQSSPVVETSGRNATHTRLLNKMNRGRSNK